MFAVANLTTIAVIGLATLFISAFFGSTTTRGVRVEQCAYFIVIGWGYLVAYLGLGRLVVAMLRQFAVVTMMACALIHVLLVLAGSGIPTSIQWMSVSMQHREYSFLQITNPFWSLYHVLNSSLSGDSLVLVIVVPAAACCMLLLNMPSIVRELRQVRTLPPTRVLEDEAELHPEPIAGPQNPWEEEN